MKKTPISDESRARGAHLNSRAAQALGIVLWAVTALWLYKPQLQRAYEVADFPQFVPILRASSSFLEGVASLTRQYAPDGRLNLAAFAILTAKWRLFGENMAFWQLARFGEMCAIAWLVFVFTRRLGSERAGAWAATVIFLASPSAAHSWVKMSIAEPPGTILLVLLGLLLMGTPRQRASASRLALLGLLVILIGFLKEVMLIAVPVVTVGVLAFEGHGRISLPLLLRDARVWAVALGGILVAIPIGVIALRASPVGYSSLWDGMPITPANFFMPFLAGLMPFAPTSAPLSVIDQLAICAFFGGLVWAWGMILKSREDKSARALVLIGIGLPMAGALVYALWPAYRLFYALPFQVGAAVLVSFAISRLLLGPRIAQVGVLAALLVITLPMLTFAHALVELNDASRRLTRDTALWLGRLESATPVAFEVCRLPPDHFASYGSVIRRYAISMQLTPPLVADVACTEGEIPVQAVQWRVIVSGETDAGPHDSERAVYPHTRLDLRELRVKRESLVVTFLPPLAPRADRATARKVMLATLHPTRR